MLKYSNPLRAAPMVAGAAVLLALSLGSIAQAQQSRRGNGWVQSDWTQRDWRNMNSPNCVLVDPVSHQCVNFHSDSTWREGFPDYHGSNGG